MFLNIGIGWACPREHQEKNPRDPRDPRASREKTRETREHQEKKPARPASIERKTPRASIEILANMSITRYMHECDSSSSDVIILSTNQIHPSFRTGRCDWSIQNDVIWAGNEAVSAFNTFGAKDDYSRLGHRTSIYTQGH
jgi:hypothetical protein